jgi:AraC-like DNA-binding protein
MKSRNPSNATVLIGNLRHHGSPAIRCSEIARLDVQSGGLMPLVETPLDLVVRSPWGRYTTTGSAVVWCASRKVSGAYVWGRPDGAETRAIVQLFDEYPRVMDATFDMIIDTRAVDTVDREALEVLTGWMWKHRSTLLERARISSVIRQEPTGFLLAGLLPTIANNRSFRVSTEPLPAYRAVMGEEGVALAEELEDIVVRLRGVPRELQAIRALLATRLDVTIDDAARALGTSARSLQRVLSRSGASFHEELVTARFAAARDLLLSTDLKIAGIASRIGISERAVTMLFRAKTGLTPMEWRNRNRNEDSR